MIKYVVCGMIPFEININMKWGKVKDLYKYETIIYKYNNCQLEGGVKSTRDSGYKTGR